MRTTHTRRTLGMALVFCSAAPTFAQGDALEPNNLSNQAVAISAPVFLSNLQLTATGVPIGDVDRFRLTLGAGEQIAVRLLDPGTNAPTPSLVDPLLLLEDANGAVIASADANAGSRFPLLYFTATQGGSFQVIVTGAGDLSGSGAHAESGAYVLAIERSAPDVFEPNESRAAANFQSSLPVDLSARLDRGDVDWFAIPAVPGANYTARLSAEQALLGALRIAAFDAAGTLIAGSAGNATFFPAVNFSLASGGTAYVAVSGAADNAFSGAHSIDATYALAIAARGLDVFEPNSTRATASVLSSLPFQAALDFSAGGTGDVDWFRFAVRRGDQVRVRTSNPGVAAIGTRVGLFRALTGNQLATASVVSPSDPFSELVYRVLQDGELALAITGRSDDNFVGNHNEVGAYDLELSLDVAEPNDELQLATPYVAGSERAQLALGPGDVDWFYVTLEANTLWRFFLRAQSGPQPALSMAIFDRFGQRMLRSDGAGGGGWPELSFRVPAADRYYIAVSGVGDTEFLGLHSVRGGYALGSADHSLRLTAVGTPDVGIAFSQIELRGSGFTTARDLNVRFSGVLGRVLSVPSATQAFVEVPDLGNSARVGIELRNMNGANTLSSAFQFVAAQPLLAGQRFAGAVANDDDWFGLPLLEGVQLDLDLRGARREGLADPTFELYDPQFNLVDVSAWLSSASNGTRLRLRRYEIPSGSSGTWYLSLRSQAGGAGGYELRTARRIPTALKRPQPTAGAGAGNTIELGLQVEAGAELSGSAFFMIGTPITSVELLDASRQPIPGAQAAIEIRAGRGEVKIRSLAMPSFGDAVIVITGPAPENWLSSSFKLKFPSPKDRLQE